jgi:hypothetical protein
LHGVTDERDGRLFAQESDTARVLLFRNV